jgi:hypothetical protein
VKLKITFFRQGSDYAKCRYQNPDCVYKSKILQEECIAMKQNQIIGWSLIICAIAITVGMVINVLVYWFIVDILVIVICLLCGILLLKNRG